MSRGSGVRGWARFPRFLTFYPFADKNSIVSSYFIIERGFFCGDISLWNVIVCCSTGIVLLLHPSSISLCFWSSHCRQWVHITTHEVVQLLRHTHMQPSVFSRHWILDPSYANALWSCLHRGRLWRTVMLRRVYQTFVQQYGIISLTKWLARLIH